jgi:signal transduction histidine kinase
MKLSATRMSWSLALGFALVTPSPAQTPAGTLTNAADVLALPAAHAARGIPISVKGIVTAAEAYWSGRFFVQDASGGVFVDNISSDRPSPGDVVEVAGISHPGAFAPVISRPTWRIVGTAPLPEARPVPIERLLSGIEDGQRIEIVGLVRSAAEEHSMLSADLLSGGCRFHVFAKLPPNVELQKLIGARVRVRGTAAPSFNAQLRRLTTVKVFAPLLEDFIVEETEPLDPFNKPLRPLGSIAQYQRDNAPGQRVRVKGVVTLQRAGEDLFLMDDASGLHVKNRGHARFSAGDVIEAVGFPNIDHFLPVLEDAACRKVDEPRADVIARRVSTEELQAGLHHANLVTLHAKLLDRIVRRSIDRANEAMQINTVMMLQAENLLFTAEAETREEPAGLVSVPIGSTVEVTGVCLSEIDEEGNLKLLKLLLPPGQPMRIIHAPSWLTPQRLTISLAAAFSVLILAVSWNFIIAKKNSTLKVLVCEKEQAQQQLQLAHNQLEERVKERTQQLKLQITARKESEFQFKTILKERTRLAQELHDTLEQTLTGIALQMDTATRLVEKRPEDANHHLGLARSLVGQGQVEVRRSVWDLRSRSLEQFDLSSALATTSRQLTDGTGIQVTVNARGRVRPLPELIEDNLLRIAQEALTNVIKHSGGTCAAIDLDYGAQSIFLEVRDNGKGFVTERCDGPLNGHFGLLGISERVKRIDGRITIHSTPETGTTLHVKIPLEAGSALPIPIFAGLDV